MARETLTWTFDWDDVVVPTAATLIDAYNQRYETSVTLDAMYTDNNPAVWQASSNAEALARVTRLLREGVTADTPPRPEMVRLFRHLAQLGDRLYVVPGRQSFLESATCRVIDEHLTGLIQGAEFTNFYVEHGSELVTRSKGEVCLALGSDVHVDDHIGHNDSVLDSGVREVIVWGDYPWNHDQLLGRRMVRCVNESELLRERARILADQ